MTPEQRNLSGIGPVMESQEPRRTFIWHVFWKNMTKLSKNAKYHIFGPVLPIFGQMKFTQKSAFIIF